MRFTIITISLLFAFGNAFSESRLPEINRGFLDLSNYRLNPEEALSLEGNWEFYWKKLYVPADFKQHKLSPEAYLTVPGTWTNKIVDGNPLPKTGYATFRLLILSGSNTQLVIYAKEIISASTIWFNGKEIARDGVVSDDPLKAKPGIKIIKELVQLDSGINEIVIQVSNYDHRLNSFEFAPVIGKLHGIEKIEFKAEVIDYSIIGILAIMAFYHLGLFVFRRKNIPVLIFAIFCFVALLRILVSVNNPIGHIFPNLSWQIIYLLKYLTLYCICPLVGFLVQITFREKKKKWLFYSFYIVSGLFILSLTLPSIIYTQLLSFYEIVAMCYFVAGLGGMLVKYVILRKDGAAILLIAVILLALTGINDMLYFQDIIKTTELLPLGIFILVLGQALTLGKQFSTVYTKNEELTKSLDTKNQNLVLLVKERTLLLEQKKLKLDASNKELHKYFTAIEQAHTTVVITDIQGNIEYANPQFETATGYAVKEVLGKNPRILGSGKTPKETFTHLWNTIKQGKVWKGEFINRKKNGEEFIESVTISPVADISGTVVNYIAIKEDITEIKRAQTALKESEEKYRLITEKSEDIIWKLDLSTRKYTYISPSVYNISGYTCEEVMRDPFDSILPQKSKDKLRNLQRRYLSIPAYKHGKGLRIQHQIVTKDGRLIDIEAAFSFITDKTDTIREVVGVSRDISLQVQIKNELKESQLKLAKLLESQTIKSNILLNQLNYIYNNTSSGIAFFKVESSEIFFSSCNFRWANSLGFTVEELEGKNIRHACDAETEILYRRFIFQALKEEKMIQEYCKWHDMDLYVNLIPIKDGNQVDSCACFVYNVTEQLNAELKIRESEAKFFKIFNNTKDAIVVLTSNLKPVEVNNSFYRIFGRPDNPNQANLDIIETFVPVTHQNRIYKLLSQLKESGTISTFECELYKFDQSIISVEISSSNIVQNGETLFLCIIRDISARKQMERMLTQVGIQIENRERRKLAADLHDNVGPLLSSMNMYLSTLSRKRELEPHMEVVSDVRRILKDTIASVREISNNISPQVLTSYGLTSALEMFFETKKKLANIVIRNNIGELRFEDSKEIMIYNIIKEAFNNSLKYSKATEIFLEIYEKNTFIHVLYKDNGIGFNLEEKLSRVTTSLGLFSIINRVKNLDGDYTIRTNPGSGFLLEVIFPIEIVNIDV